MLEDQAATTTRDEAQFDRKLEQLDRYLEDQILVLHRQRSGLERKIEEANRRRERAAVPSSQTREDRAFIALREQIHRLDQRLQRLQQAHDDDYQKWRTRLYERRYQRPTVERILQVDFRIGGGAAC